MNKGVQHSLNRFVTALYVLLFTVIITLNTACFAQDPSLHPSFTTPAKSSYQASKEITASILISEDSTLTENTIGEIVITPSIVFVDPGASITLTANAFLSDGNQVFDANLIWSMTDLRAGNIQQDGQFVAGLVPGEYLGAVTVTARLGNGAGLLHSFASIPVTIIGNGSTSILEDIVVFPSDAQVIAGQLYRLHAIGYDERGQVLPAVKYTWSVRDPAIGELNSLGYLSVSSTSGKYVNGITVTGEKDGVRITRSVHITIRQFPDKNENLTVQILPQRFHIDRGENLQLEAFALNGLGEVVAGTQLRWVMQEPTAGSVSGTGLFKAGISSGVFPEALKVEAIIPGENGVIHAADFASVVVRKQHEVRRLTTMVPRPRSVNLEPGGRIILSVDTKDADGKLVDDVDVTWKLESDAVGKIDQYGNFKASNNPGIYDSAVTAVATQNLDGVRVTMNAMFDIGIIGELKTATVQPELATVTQGDTVHFNAMGFDANGLQNPGLLVRWRLAHPDLGTIDQLGNFTAKASPGLYADAIIATVIQITPD